MSKAKPTILDEPRYPEFVDRYQFDSLRFAVEVCGLAPSADQEDLLRAMDDPQARVSVASGTTTGKTAAFGRIALHSLLAFPFAYYEGKLEIGSNTYIGAPRIQQVADGVWKEMADSRLAISNGPFAWLLDYFDVTNTRVAVKGFEDQWFIAQVALQAGQSVGIAGKHRYFQLVIVDEAAGVSDEHFNVINGTQTQPGNRTLLASQGVKNTGFFYETHHNLCELNGGAWKALCFDSERSPFVTLKWLRDRERETGGRDSVEYRIRVKGQFPDDSSTNLLSRRELERCFEPRKTPLIGEDEAYGFLILSDVAMGEYRDDSVIWVAKVIGYGDLDEDARRVEFVALPYCKNDRNEIDFAGELVDVYGKTNNATMLVDNGGVGAAVVKLVERSGVPVQRVDWGKPCFKKDYQARFYNQRACAMVRFRDAVRQGRVHFNLTGLDQRTKEKILLQGSRLPYHFAEAGGLRYVMEKKEVMRENGIKSPDLIDAASFAFLEDATYIVRDGGQLRAREDKREQAVQDMADMLEAELGEGA